MGDMRCPACNSWECDYDKDALMFKEVEDGLWAYYMAWCHTCNLAFVFKKWFIHLDYHHKCISARDFEKDERRTVRTGKDVGIIDMISTDIRRCKSLTARMDDRKMAERLDELFGIVHEYANKKYSEEYTEDVRE